MGWTMHKLEFLSFVFFFLGMCMGLIPFVDPTDALLVTICTFALFLSLYSPPFSL